MNKLFYLFFFGLCLFSLFSCEKTIPVSGISVSPSALSLDEGETAKLVATISPNDADNQTVTWLSKDNTVATVSNGVVTANKAGFTYIIASSSDGGFSASCSVTVLPAFKEVETISLSLRDITLIVGETETISASIKPDNATDKTLRWSSSDTGVATIDDSGTITTHKKGDVIIKCNAGRIEAECKVTVLGRGLDQPGNYIFYTNVSNEIVEPFKIDVFGASVVSNSYRKEKGLIKFDSDVTEIGVDAFYGKSLDSIEIPYSVGSIGGGAFRYSFLRTIVIPSSVKSIGGLAFDSCRYLVSVEASNGLINIGNSAFQQCRELVSVTLPDSVEDIGTYAFSGCVNLQSIVIPKNVTRIRMLTFWACSGLTSVILPEGLVFIDGNAFSQCDNLESIIIPEQIRWILDKAFEGCRRLSSIEVKAVDPPQLGDNAFKDTGDCPILVPLESVEVYKRARGWSDYADRIQAIPE